MQPIKSALPFYAQPRLARFYTVQSVKPGSTTSQISPSSAPVVLSSVDLSARAVCAPISIPSQATVQLLNPTTVASCILDTTSSEIATQAPEKIAQNCVGIESVAESVLISSPKSAVFSNAPSATSATDYQSTTDTHFAAPVLRETSPVLGNQETQTLLGDSPPGKDVWGATGSTSFSGSSGDDTLDCSEATSGEDSTGNDLVRLYSHKQSGSTALENHTVVAMPNSNLKRRSDIMDRFISTPDHPIHAAQMLCGYWDGSAEPKEIDKHAVYGYVDLKNTVRTDVIQQTRDGRELSSLLPERCHSIRREYIVLEPHLKHLTREQLREYIAAQLQRWDGETTLPALNVRELTPRVVRRKYTKKATTTTRRSSLSHSDDSEASLEVPLERYTPKKRQPFRESADEANQPIENGTDNDKPSTPASAKTSYVILGYWRGSDGLTVADKHAFVGTISTRYDKQLQMKTSVVARTRDGREYIGNSPKGIFRFKAITEGVLEPELQELSPQQLKQYVIKCLDAMDDTGKEFQGPGIVNMEALKEVLASSAEDVEEPRTNVEDARQTSREMSAHDSATSEPAAPETETVRSTWPAKRTPREVPKRKRRRRTDGLSVQESEGQTGQKKSKTHHAGGETKGLDGTVRRMSTGALSESFASENSQPKPMTSTSTDVPRWVSEAVEAGERVFMSSEGYSVVGSGSAVEDREPSSPPKVASIPRKTDARHLPDVSGDSNWQQSSFESRHSSVALVDSNPTSTKESVQNHSSAVNGPQPTSDLLVPAPTVGNQQSEQQGVRMSLSVTNGSNLVASSIESRNTSMATPSVESRNSSVVTSEETVKRTSNGVQSPVTIAAGSNQEDFSNGNHTLGQSPGHAAPSSESGNAQPQPAMNVPEVPITIGGITYSRKSRPPFQEKLVSDKLNMVDHNNATYLNFDILEIVNEELEFSDGVWYTTTDDGMGDLAIGIRHNQKIHMVNGVAMEVVSRLKQFTWTAGRRFSVGGVDGQSICTRPINLEQPTLRSEKKAPADPITIGEITYSHKSNPPFQDKLVSDKLSVVDRNNATYLKFDILEIVNEEVEFSDGVWYTTTDDGMGDLAIGIRDNQKVHMVNGVVMEVVSRLKQFTWTAGRKSHGGGKAFGS